MSEQLPAASAAVAQAEQWGERHAAFLTAVFERWQADGAWPGAEGLGRQGLREEWDFDAFELAEKLPRPLGTLQRGLEEPVVLRVRGLSFAPPAWSLLRDFTRAVRLSAELYVHELGEPELRAEHLTCTLGLDPLRAKAIMELLTIEYWMFGSGGGDPGPDWHHELRRGCRYLVHVESLADYLRVEGDQVWGRPRAMGIPLVEGPIGDDLLVMVPTTDVAPVVSTEAAPGAPSTSSATASVPADATDDVPSVFISYAHKDKSAAGELAGGLEAEGLRVWIDDNELLAGDSIIEQISKAVAGIDFFLALVSEASRESRWCQHELNLAMTTGLGPAGATIIPVRVGNVAMPESILDKLYVSLDPANVAAAVERIARDVRRHRERRRQLGQTVTADDASGAEAAEHRDAGAKPDGEAV